MLALILNKHSMQQSVICILDSLGTKGIWTEGSVERYFKIINEIQTDILNPAKEKFKELAKGIPVDLDFISFSDTLVITLMKTQKDELKDDFLFHHTIEGFNQVIGGIFQYYFADSFFLRGAISFGEMEKRGGHFVGPAVDDAAEYFELPNMIGICFTPKATLAMDYAIGWNKKYFGKQIDQHVIKYKTPLKNKSEVDLYQVNWPKSFYETSKNDPIGVESRLSSYLSNRNIPLLAVSKFTNSINFFKESTKNCR